MGASSCRRHRRRPCCCCPLPDAGAAAVDEATAAAAGSEDPQQPFDAPLMSSAEEGMAPTRSVALSDAQLMQRCKDAVERCRGDLADLRSACKAANSHREKCADLLAAATSAVVALEELLYSPSIDVRQERNLLALAHKVQIAMDQVGAGLGAGMLVGSGRTCGVLPLLRTAACRQGAAAAVAPAALAASPSACPRWKTLALSLLLLGTAAAG